MRNQRRSIFRTSPASSSGFAEPDASRDHPDEDEADQGHQQDRDQALGGGRDRREGHDQEQEDGEECDEAIHALYVTTARKQLAINPPSSGTVRQNPDVTRRATERRRIALVREAERIIRERYGEFDLSLGDIAEAAGTSTRELQRAFREQADTEFRAVLLHVRVAAAKRLLGRDRTVPAAAQAVGYRGASGLKSAFRRIGEPPPSTFQPKPPEYIGTMDEPAEAPPFDW
jgi:AraC-like DNA-binding protein